MQISNFSSPVAPLAHMRAVARHLDEQAAERTRVERRIVVETLIEQGARHRVHVDRVDLSPAALRRQRRDR